MPGRHLARHKAPRSVSRSLGRFAADLTSSVPSGGVVGAVGLVGAAGVAAGLGMMSVDHAHTKHTALGAAAEHRLPSSAPDRRTSPTLADRAGSSERAARVRDQVSRSSSRPPLLSAQRAAKRKALGGAGQAVSGAVTHTVAPTDPRAIAMSLLGSYGWSSSEFTCLDALWQRESGWDTSATNPYSGAYGIPQALPGSKMASYGPDWSTNPATQIRWGLAYIRDSYGSPCGAWDFWQSNDWY